MAFDSKTFYDELDSYYSKYDNAATEKFLLNCLENVESSVYLASGCCSCGDGECSDDKELSEGERDWIITRSQGLIAVLNELACFYRGLGRWEDCMKNFDRLRKEMESCGLEETENYALVTLNLAGAYRLMGKFDEALGAFVKAGKLIEKSGDPYALSSLYNNTGLVYQDMKEFARAAESFEKAIELMPKTPENEAEIATSHNNLAMAYYGAGEQEKAEAALEKALDIFSRIDGGMNPHYAGGLNTKALFAFNKKDYAAAVKLFEQAVEKTRLIFGENHEFVIGCRNCALACSRLGDRAGEEKYTKMADEAEAKIG